jgi:hypothetical protein
MIAVWEVIYKWTEMKYMSWHIKLDMWDHKGAKNRVSGPAKNYEPTENIDIRETI